MNRTSFLPLLAVTILLGVAGRIDYEVHLAEEKHYCAMVAAYKAGSHLGWPDFNGIYETVCPNHLK